MASIHILNDVFDGYRKFIEVDGHKMHITGNGTGQPTVVMTCGSGSTFGYADFYCINSMV